MHRINENIKMVISHQRLMEYFSSSLFYYFHLKSKFHLSSFKYFEIYLRVFHKANYSKILRLATLPLEDSFGLCHAKPRLLKMKTVITVLTWLF